MDELKNKSGKSVLVKNYFNHLLKIQKMLIKNESVKIGRSIALSDSKINKTSKFNKPKILKENNYYLDNLETL